MTREGWILLGVFPQLRDRNDTQAVFVIPDPIGNPSHGSKQLLRMEQISPVIGMIDFRGSLFRNAEGEWQGDGILSLEVEFSSLLMRKLQDRNPMRSVKWICTIGD